jgi:hypothetical protein
VVIIMAFVLELSHCAVVRAGQMEENKRQRAAAALLSSAARAADGIRSDAKILCCELTCNQCSPGNHYCDFTYCGSDCDGCGGKPHDAGSNVCYSNCKKCCDGSFCLGDGWCNSRSCMLTAGNGMRIVGLRLVRGLRLYLELIPALP